MNAIKTYPIQTVTFSEQSIDGQGKTSLGQPATVAAVWARRNGKKGGILSWDMSPKNLGDGQYRLEENRPSDQGVSTGTPKTYRISFSEKRDDLTNGSQLGRPVDVASVQENGVISWSISPQRLNEGVFFVLENERQQQQGKGDALDQITTTGQQQHTGLAR